MRGTKQIRVSNRILQYRFAVNRNITVVTGNSGTGKTTLYDLIAEHTRLGESSGVRIKADAPCIALTDIDWLNQLRRTSGSSIDSQQYFSWENFFEDYLVQQTAGTHYAYSKSQLHSFYTVRENSGRIVALIAANMPKA